jgi:hypothetical protein
VDPDRYSGRWQCEWNIASSASDSIFFSPSMRRVNPGFTNRHRRPVSGWVRTTGCLLVMTSPLVSPGTNAARGALWIAESVDANSRIVGESPASAASRSIHMVSPPQSGTTMARRIEPFGGSGENVTSVCHPSATKRLPVSPPL